MITTRGKIMVTCCIIILACMSFGSVLYIMSNKTITNICNHDIIIKFFDYISYEKILYKQCDVFRNMTIMQDNREYCVIDDIVVAAIIEYVIWIALASFVSFIFEVILDGDRDKSDDFLNIRILDSFGMSNLIVGIIATIMCTPFAGFDIHNIMSTVSSCVILPAVLILSLTFISHKLHPNAIYGVIIRYFNPTTANVDELKHHYIN